MRYFFNHLVDNAASGIEIALLTRLVFRVLQANESAIIVRFIYNLTDYLIIPVDYIFPNIPVGNSIFDIVGISAMIFYAVIYLLIAKLFKFLHWAR